MRHLNEPSEVQVGSMTSAEPVLCLAQYDQCRKISERAGHILSCEHLHQIRHLVVVVPALVQVIEQILKERGFERLSNTARMHSHHHDSVFSFLRAIHTWVWNVWQHRWDVEGSVVWPQDDLLLVVADSDGHLALEDLESLGLTEVDMQRRRL